MILSTTVVITPMLVLLIIIGVLCIFGFIICIVAICSIGKITEDKEALFEDIDDN